MLNKIIDFHTHPIFKPEQNILMYKDSYDFTIENFKENLLKSGISKFCGSVINPNKDSSVLEKVLDNNACAYKLCEIYGGDYIPGIHIHPDYIEESFNQIDEASSREVRLIGELVPYLDGWDYSHKGIHPILDYAEKKGMIVSVHSTDSDALDSWILEHPNLIIVGAHPGDWSFFFKQLERLKKYDNYMLDISATGITRFGMLKKLVDEIGSERILFGSDYPSCDPNVFISGVLQNPLLSDSDKENILFKNAQRLLNIKI